MRARIRIIGIACAVAIVATFLTSLSNSASAASWWGSRWRSTTTTTAKATTTTVKATTTTVKATTTTVNTTTTALTPTTTGVGPLLRSGSTVVPAKWFPSSAPWNRPVSAFGRSGRYDSYADRFFDYANYGGWTDPKHKGQIDLSLKDYSVPIYDAAQATQRRRVFQATWSKSIFEGFGNLGQGATIPWNPAWQPGTGLDRILIINDNVTGQTWSVWGSDLGGFQCFDLQNIVLGMDFANDLCMAGVTYHAESYRTRPGTYSERGMGIEKLALITTADEVASGAIPHALEMTVFNTMFGGPSCSPDAPGAGVDCGFFLPPSTKVEWPNGYNGTCGANNIPTTSAMRSRTVPEGMRFALDITDAQINAWLDSRGYAGAKRETARIFAVGLRDYGWIIAETGCWGAAIETDGVQNPTAAAKWRALGVDETSGNLLHGLLTRENIYVVNPPQ